MDSVPSPGYSVIAALIVFIVASVWLGMLAQRVVGRGSFMTGYFLGNRGLGAWAMALTATVQSGGTFMGFPSLVYSHGWVVALWISSYMVVPIMGFALIGKRFCQLSRRTGAITVPDLFRERFGSPAVGLTSSLLIMGFLSIMMVAQFKAGAIVMKLAWPGTGWLSFSETTEEPEPEKTAEEPEEQAEATEGQSQESQASNTEQPEREEVAGASKTAKNGVDTVYLIGLVIFSVTVVGYTVIGGFLASVWTDLFQSVMMLVGVILLLILALPAAGGLEAATLNAVDNTKAVDNTSADFVFGPGHPQAEGQEFLPIGLAFSMFFMWTFAGFGGPTSMVRVMAAQNTEVLRKSICLLSLYNCLIYLPLIVICICGRAIMPGLDKTDEIIPRLALLLTQDIPGGSFAAGLILAAPFGAVMATVSCYLLVIASGLVQDVYLRFLRPHATVAEIKRVSYVAMVVVGGMAIGLNISPVPYLQALVILSGACSAAAFVTPALMAAYWRRATVPGVMAAMLVGAATMLSLYLYNTVAPLVELATGLQLPAGVGKLSIASPLPPVFLLGLDPIVWGLAASAAAGIVVSLATKPLPDSFVDRFFAPSGDYVASKS